MDDIQGLDDVLTDQAKQKKMETFQKDILFAGDEAVYRNGNKIKSGTKFLICGTVLAPDCFISKLIRDKTYKSIVKRAVLVDDIDALFTNEYWSSFRDLYYDNKNQYAEIDAKNFYYENEDEMKFPVLWEDKWHPIEIALKYYSDPIGFKQEMMNDSTILTGGKCFFAVKTIPRTEMDDIDFDRSIMTVDCAVEVGKRNDYTSICVGSRGINGHRYIRKGLLMKVDFDTYVKKVIGLLKEFPELTHIIIEKNTYQGVDAKEIQKKIDEDQQLSNRNITIVNERQMKNKENRIRAMSGKINNGFIIFAKEDEDFYNQILEYQGSDIGHDDAADTVSEFDSRIDEIEIRKEIKSIPRGWLF
ncbi:putative phage terminase large subunit-like protein [Ammoniphilus resinae]|uniref:Phage terminase large subunit-like protein n=1 Tax=Ammoniphilus resinae TaxID=861532 RepID=A0ABS4GXT8_9BACL|nr:putative phage terminase large subunit-like protein [Ammoniphilus resinae]